MMDNFSLDFAVSNDWGDGFNADISIANTGEGNLKNWVLEFEFPHEITNIWNAEIVSKVGSKYTIRHASWNSTIPTGAKTSFGFTSTAGNVTSRQPSNYVLNGEPLGTPTLLPKLSIDDVALAEGDTGNTLASFDVKLSAASDETVKVKYATVDDTAIAGKDYKSATGELSFAPGETQKTVFVSVIGDTTPEADESFFLELSNPSQASIADFQGVGTITNDDKSSSILPQLSIEDISFNEGDSNTTNQVATVNLSEASDQTITVKYNTTDGSAQADSDYTAKSGTLTFEPGETSQTITLAIAGDTLDEGQESFKINLSKPTNATISDNQGVVTILDNDKSNSQPEYADFNYGEALQKSFLFYEAQRSGKLPDDNRVAWRGDSALNDGADVGINLTGGYYDAGDHVKFGFPMASAMTMLGWGVVQYGDAYRQSGQLDEALDAIKWGTDYLLKAHVTDSKGTKEFWGQVGQGNIDHSYWGSAEEMKMARPAFKIDRQNPGSDLAGESAAALAAASVAFRSTDTAYADLLLDNAEDLFEFADTYRGKYSDSIPDAAQYYNSWSGYNDELVWAATWLHKATGDNKYLNKAESYYQGINQGWTQSWDDKSHGGAILLAQETGKDKYRNDVEDWLDHWTDESGSGITKTAGGLAWLDQWGSLRYSANTAFLASIYGDTVNDPGGRYTDFAQEQVDYILGDNPNNFSYMVGFGDNFPQNPHHRGASGTNNISDPNDNLHILYGALVGGPSAANDHAYNDDRSDFISNEVALDYNTGLTGALASMYGKFEGESLDNIFAGNQSMSVTSQDLTAGLSS
ncbi:glycoside hydrolase family 9 protein [Lyngbya aestuarii]|uniref:glycoside hydrolase family 9 protein n=1 Tax=Lyngbya aestuarii TaxID=118322 RepID=UPI00403D662A